MSEFRQLAEKIDQQMQYLDTQNVRGAPAIINRMMGYVPDLHKIWVNTSDEQLMALSREFPGFYRYALIMEKASEAERKKASRPYDNLAQLSEEQKQQGHQLLTTAATLERGYQALQSGRNLPGSQSQNELDKLYRQWLADLDSFKNTLSAEYAEPKVLEYVNEAFGRLDERIKQLAGDHPSLFKGEASLLLDD